MRERGSELRNRLLLPCLLIGILTSCASTFAGIFDHIGIPDTNFIVHFVAEGRIGNNRLVPGGAFGAHEVSLLSPPGRPWQCHEIAQFVWCSGVSVPFRLTYSASVHRAHFVLGNTSVWHDVSACESELNTIVLRTVAARHNTSITVTLLELNGRQTNVSLTVSNGPISEAWLVLALPSSTDGVTTVYGAAVLNFPSGPGMPRNHQLSFQIFAGTLPDSEPPPPDPDLDDDGLPDEWELQYFENIWDCNPSDDTDGDGASNSDEYVAGTDPTDGASALFVTMGSVAIPDNSRSPEKGAGSTVVPLVQWTSATNRTYSVWRSATLMNGAARFERIAEGIAATPPYNIFTDTTAIRPGPYYYRIQTSR